MGYDFGINRTQRKTVRTLLAFLLSIACLPSFAADIRVPMVSPTRSMGGIMIEGEIVEGDYAKFEKLVMQIFNPGVVWLASPGGDLVEAMRIGRLIRELKLSVWAPPKSGPLFPMVDSKRNAVCASACFFIYAAGVERKGEVLGIHRPYMSASAYRRMGLDEAALRQSVAMKVSGDYLREMGISSALVERMNGIGSEKIVWLTESEASDLTGFIPEYTEWFKANCPPTIGRDGNLDQEKMFGCRSKLLEEEQKGAKLGWLVRSAQKK